MKSAREVFVVGLRNAHALENQALSIMDRQLERLEKFPELADRLKRHVDETNEQLRRLELIMDEMKIERSSLKDAAASMMGSMAALAHTVAADEILKNTFASSAFENYEIAGYKSLIALAPLAGYESAVSSLQESLREERAMAEWLDDNIAPITLRYVQLEGSDARTI